MAPYCAVLMVANCVPVMAPCTLNTKAIMLARAQPAANGPACPAVFRVQVSAWESGIPGTVLVCTLDCAETPAHNAASAPTAPCFALAAIDDALDPFRVSATSTTTTYCPRAAGFCQPCTAVSALPPLGTMLSASSPSM